MKKVKIDQISINAYIKINKKINYKINYIKFKCIH